MKNAKNNYGRICLRKVVIGGEFKLEAILYAIWLPKKKADKKR